VLRSSLRATSRQLLHDRMRGAGWAARHDSCLVCLEGRDTTQTKASAQSFAKSDRGLTCVSASGCVLPCDSGDGTRMVVPLSLIAPFLTHSQVGGHAMFCSGVRLVRSC
jgi:hypothetical protein